MMEGTGKNFLVHLFSCVWMYAMHVLFWFGFCFLFLLQIVCTHVCVGWCAHTRVWALVQVEARG